MQKWEQGGKKPNGPFLKLLNLVDRKGLDVLA
ncbi:helix-turn-helix domain-containing protein [Microbulbifer pacificus]